MKFELHGKDTLFPSVRLALIATKTGIWHTLSNNFCLPSQSFNCMRSGKAKTGFQLNVEKWPISDSGRAVLAKKPYFETRIESHQDGSKSSACECCSLADSKKKGGCQGQHSQYIAVYYYITMILISCAGWYSSKISGSMEKQTFQYICA